MGSSPSFSTPNFLSGAFGKGFNFMIASDHKLILRFFWWSEKMQLWSRAIIKLKHFSGVPDKKLGVENDGLDPTKLFTRPKIRKSFFSVMDFCKTFWEISDFFIISHILTFWKMLFRSLKKVCDEVSKIKNLRCTFFSFFRARRHGIWLFSNILRVWRQIGVENGPFLVFGKNQKSLKKLCKNSWLKKMIYKFLAA